VGKNKKDALLERLESAGIDVSTWGEGTAKTVEHLLAEVKNRECVLTDESDGSILRKVVVAGADVYYTKPNGRKYRLVESRQVFKDGREREREYATSVAEKIFIGEDPKVAVIRGIKEELGIEGSMNPVKISQEETTRISKSYPGLLTYYMSYIFKVVLDDSQFNPEGYVEKQSDKQTYFSWIELEVG